MVVALYMGVVGKVWFHSALEKPEKPGFSHFSELQNSKQLLILRLKRFIQAI
jgi:hypothetical protein